MYAKSLDELHEMVDWLMEELASVGLQLNGSKTKILTTMADPPNYVNIQGEMVEILFEATSQEY